MINVRTAQKWRAAHVIGTAVRDPKRKVAGESLISPRSSLHTLRSQLAQEVDQGGIYLRRTLLLGPVTASR
jgi:hypothetical protein